MSTTTPIIKKLNNGLTVLLVPEARATVATALVVVRVGSAYEAPKENGLSHFLEHMCFKGTAGRPTSKIITEEIESLGAISNAVTDREYTGYFIKGNPSHLDVYLNILSDIYLNSTLPQGEIDKEKGVIIEEINMYEDMPQYKVGDILLDTMYPHHAVGRAILGTKETVASFKHADFMEYKKKYYTGSNTILILAGKVSPQKAIKTAKNKFGALARGEKNNRKKVIDTQKSPTLKVHHKATDQAHFSLAFRSLPLGHKDLPALRLLATILGRGMSSRLALLVREELGAAYYVYAQAEGMTDHGLFYISAGIDKTRLTEVLERVIAECKILKDTLVTQKELDKAKEYSVGTFRLGLELSDDVANFYGGQLILGQKIKTPEQVVASIKKVSSEDLRRVASHIFKSSNATLAVVGPYQPGDVAATIFRGL